MQTIAHTTPALASRLMFDGPLHSSREVFACSHATGIAQCCAGCLCWLSLLAANCTPSRSRGHTAYSIINRRYLSCVQRPGAQTAMVKRWPIALAALLLLSAFAACRAQDFDISDDSDDADADVEEVAKPFLLARKFLPGKDLVMGVNTTIAIELYNAGKRCTLAQSIRFEDSLLRHRKSDRGVMPACSRRPSECPGIASRLCKVTCIRGQSCP